MRFPQATAIIRQKAAVSTDHAGTIADLAFFFFDDLAAGDLDLDEIAESIGDAIEAAGADKKESIKGFFDSLTTVATMRGVPMVESTHNGHGARRIFEPREPDATFTDRGFLARFAKLHEGAFYFVPEWNCYTAWTGTVWDSEHGDALFWEAVTKTAADLEPLEILEIKRDEKVEDKADKISRLMRFMTRYRNAAGCRAIAEMAKHDMRFRKPNREFDQQHMLLNCANGTLDLKTGRLGRFDKNDFLTRQLKIDYEPAAEAPAWQAFLSRIVPDAATRAFLQSAIGYSLTGDVSEQCMFICYGSGANGKSTFLEAIEYIASPYHVKAAMSTFAQRESSDTSDLARMRAARLVTVSENDENARLSEGLIKTATGDNQITARELYRNPFTFSPRFKVWMAVNHRPIIRGQDDGIWRRLKLIPFETKIEDSEKDMNLGAKLRAEAAGILAWIVAGCLAWQVEGFKPPEKIIAAAAGYREEMDIIGRWIEENCDVGEPYFEYAADLYTNFAAWAKQSGEFPMTNTLFGRRLGDRGFPIARAQGGKKTRRGLQLNFEARRNGHRMPLNYPEPY